MLATLLVAACVLCSLASASSSGWWPTPTDVNLQVASSQYSPTINETFQVTCAWKGVAPASAGPIELQVASSTCLYNACPRAQETINWTHISPSSTSASESVFDVRFDSSENQLPRVCDFFEDTNCHSELRLWCFEDTKGHHPPCPTSGCPQKNWSPTVSVSLHKPSKPASQCARLGVGEAGLWNVDQHQRIQQCAALNCTGAVQPKPTSVYRLDNLGFMHNETLWCEDPGIDRTAQATLCQTSGRASFSQMFEWMTCNETIYEGTYAGCPQSNLLPEQGRTTGFSAADAQAAFDSCVSAKDVAGKHQCLGVVYGWQSDGGWLSSFNNGNRQCQNGWCVACAHEDLILSLTPWTQQNCASFRELMASNHWGPLQGTAQIYEYGCGTEPVEKKHDLVNVDCVLTPWSPWSSPLVGQCAISLPGNSFELSRTRSASSVALGAGQCGALQDNELNPQNTEWCFGSGTSRDSCSCGQNDFAVSWCEADQSCFPTSWIGSAARPKGCASGLNTDVQCGGGSGDFDPYDPSSNRYLTPVLIGGGCCVLLSIVIAIVRKRRRQPSQFRAFNNVPLGPSGNYVAPHLMPTGNQQQQQQQYLAPPPKHLQV